MKWMVTATAAAVSISLAVQAADLSGPAQVIDADSLYIGGHKVRLSAIDAPEWKQVCTRPGQDKWMAGQEATAWLKSRLADRTLSCTEEGQDRYGRKISTCYVDGKDLNEMIVRAGWAFAYRYYSKRYVAAEMAANASGAGIWAGECGPPWDWRRKK